MMLTMLENGLFALGQVLRAPVMALLWVGIFAVLFASGAALMELVARRRERHGFDLKSWLKQGAVLDSQSERAQRLPQALRSLLDDVRSARGESSFADGALENLLLEREERLRRSLNLPRALVKVGPSLGLLGTLIPMGTSLASLASGNLEAMAGQMVVAFTTTIIGLAIGTLAYVITTVRQGWLNEAVREQRYLAEHIARELEGR
jgi:biopolymer transport protein ExbB/TolQ